MKKNYHQVAEARLSSSKWEYIGIQTAIVYLVIMAVCAQWVDTNIALVLIIPALVSISMMVLVGPTYYPEKDQNKIALYADYLEKLDALEEKRKIAAQENSIVS